MNIRTSHITVIFAKPFLLEGFADRQPAGEYRVDIDEERIEGISFLAYRRVAALIHLPKISAPQNSTQSVTMRPTEFDAMIAFDAR
ncbi:hypothetical protein GCM10007874_45720 [Labrys miyagiensis]|uniref:Uncharacterized protein n=1 Tax=Labrys miyagiensis TaxID=346912 RepID=A0ABQ6CP15_9HYPH|nr:hypothetical protein [Labrys miyagiensis]GLS21555.1 hypothetical protein GCM10007874_45720 [Labrys miyagiensis]